MSIIDTFDCEKDAIINPLDLTKPIEGFPEIVILTFSYKIMANFINLEGVTKIAETKSVNGLFPIYKMKYKEKEVAFYMTPVGASFSVGTLEEVIAMGAKKVIVFGTCGVLDKSIVSGRIIVPTAAYRDEGTSYHYVKASDYISLKNAEQLTNILTDLDIEHVVGKTWTTDAIYRETRTNFQKRKSEGCLAVEMECSALAAVCDFRDVELYQFIYGADSLDGTAWDRRILGKLNDDERNRYMLIALEIANYL